MNKLALFLLSLTLLSITNISSTHAAQTAVTPECTPIYGGGQSCLQIEELSVDLQVKNPQTNTYVTSIPASGPTMNPGQEVNYKITIKNTVNRQLSNITVTVVFPQLVNYASGTGKFDTKTRKLSFPIETLKANESKVFTINGKVLTKDKITSQSVVCSFTQAIASFDRKTSQDNTQFCINPQGNVVGTTNRNVTKGGLPVYSPSNTKTTPQTGPETLALIGLLPAGALGFWLRHKTAFK